MHWECPGPLHNSIRKAPTAAWMSYCIACWCSFLSHVAGPRHDGGMQATAQDGPVGAAATTVDGSLIFSDTASSGGTLSPSPNLFQFAATGTPTGSAAYNQMIPTGTPPAVPTGITGPFGNSGSSDGNGIVIGAGIEFATAFLAATNIGPGLFQVYVDITEGGQIAITRYLYATAPAVAALQGVMTLTSTLFQGATSINPVTPSTRMEEVLAETFELEEPKEGATAHQAAAAPGDKKKAATGPPPVRTLAWGALGFSLNSATGTITFTFPQGSWEVPPFPNPVSPDTTTYQLVSGFPRKRLPSSNQASIIQSLLHWHCQLTRYAG